MHDYFKELPYSNLTDYQISFECMSVNNGFLRLLDMNNFSLDMSRYVNNISANNYLCQYANESTFSNILAGHSKTNLNTFYLNIRSLNLHKYELNAYLSSLKCEFDIICITECGKISSACLESLFEGYKCYFNLSNTSKGGTCIMIRNNTFDHIEEHQDLTLIPECNCTPCKVESNFIRAIIGKNEYIIGCIYRHPGGSISHFNQSLQKVISNIKTSNTCIIAGDINVNLIDSRN